MAHSVAGSIALLAWRLLEKYGVDPVETLEGLGVDYELLEDSRTKISYQVSDEIWKRTQRAIDDESAGLSAAELWHPTTFGVLGYAMLSSNTLRASLECLVRYQEVEARESSIVLIEKEHGLLVMQTTERHQSGEYPMLVDAAFSAWLHICRFNYMDNFDPVEVNLKREKPASAGHYYEFYRCPVNFGADSNCIVFPYEEIDKTLPAANRDLAKMHDKVLQGFLNELNEHDLSHHLKETITYLLPSGKLTKEAVAKEHCMSGRTMQRRLEEEGTSYQEVLNETRRDMAVMYIKEDRLSLTEIAFRLGFSDSATFSRAFKRWTGQTPSSL